MNIEHGVYSEYSHIGFCPDNRRNSRDFLVALPSYQLTIVKDIAMKTFALPVAVALLASADAFTVPANSQTGVTLRTTALYGYVPDGFTAESYKKFKEQEAKKAAKQNLGKVGPRGFQSRSMQSFQEAMERGEATHLLPVFNAKERIKNGELKVEDIPVSLDFDHVLHVMAWEVVWLSDIPLSSIGLCLVTLSLPPPPPTHTLTLIRRFTNVYSTCNEEEHGIIRM